VLDTQNRYNTEEKRERERERERETETEREKREDHEREQETLPRTALEAKDGRKAR